MQSNYNYVGNSFTFSCNRGPFGKLKEASHGSNSTAHILVNIGGVGEVVTREKKRIFFI